MPSLHLSRTHRPQTAPERDFDQNSPSFMPSDRLGWHRRSATDGQTQSGLLSARRRFSAATLLDQNRFINSARQLRQRSSSSAGLPSSGSNLDHRLGHWNAWLPQPSTRVPTNNIKQFVAERKASVQSVAHRIRPRSTIRGDSFVPLGTALSSKPAVAQSPVPEGSTTHRDQLIGGSTLHPLNKSQESIASKRRKQNITLGSQGAHSSRTHPLSAVEPHQLSVRIPKAGIAQDASWISELKATSPFDDPFEDFQSSADHYRLRRARRHSWLGHTKAPNTSTQQGNGERKRRPSAPAHFDSGLKVLQSPVSKMTPLTPSSEGARSKRLSSQSFSSLAHPTPSTRPSLKVHSRAGKRLSQISHYGSGSDQVRSEQQDDDSESHHVFHITDHQTLQMRVLQLENELRMSRYNTDMWMSRYGALAATNPSSGKRQEQDRPQRIETDAGSETSYSLSIPPHQKKPRRLTSFEQSIRSERESAIPPAKEAAVSDNMLPPSTDSVDVQTGRATRMNSYRSDSSTGSVLKARAQVSPPAETLAQTKRPENDSEPAPLLRPLSVCEQIDYLADGGREGIDSATLNSLMPEDGSSKRQRGLSGSAATGITQMAAGLKAKLRTGKAGDRLSPAASQGMLPPMPLKSPNRPTVKLFGRRSSALPSSNVSLKEDSASLLVSSPMPMKGSEVSSVHGFLLHPPGESKGPSGSPTPAQALAADYGRNRSASVVSRLSINTLQSATRRVSTTLGPTMKGKGNALRLSGMGNSAATPKAPTRTITTGMIGSPVLVASTDQRTDTVEETPDPYAHRRSIATSRSIAPEWLESIAMDTSSSDENEDSQEPVQDPEQSAGLSSAMASSTVLSQYAENSLPRSLSKTIISKPLPESSIEHRLDDKPLPEVQDCEAGVQSPAELEEEQREELRHQEDERLLADKPHGVSPSHTPAYTPSVSTLSSLKTHNHEPRPLLNASEDVGRPSEELGLEQFSFLVAEAPDEGMTTGKQKSGRMEKSNSKSTTLGQLGQISPPASSPEVGSSGPQSCAETPAGDESNSLRLPDTTGQRGLVSTRTSNRSSTSLRNRLGRASSFLPNSPSPVSQSSRNMGSHDVHTSVPQSPGPPSPALTPSPKEKELPEPVPARTETEQSGKSPSKSPIPKRRAEPALASTDQDLKPNATPASSRSSLLKKLRPSLIPRKSASTMKSSSSDMGSQSESDQKNGDRSVLTRPTVPKSTSFSSQRKLLDRGLAEPGDSSLPIVTIGKKEAAPPAAPVERPVSKDGVQALALDWLHAHTLVEQGFEAADVDVDDQVQAADESRSSSKIPVRSQTIGSGLGLHVARPKDAAPAVPAKNPTPLYAHITPPGSDGGQ